jgi:two-component system response regulator RegX3
VLLDVMLPGLDGVSVCRELRLRRPSQPILLLTARGGEDDILRGFDAGADDYVCKPFSVAQLMARVHALLRRAGKEAPNRFTVGPVTVDGSALRASADEASVDLTARDVELLAYLAGRRAEVVSREELLRSVWGFQRIDRVETRCVDMHVAKLRKKLAQVGAEELITTVRGVGYRCD